MRFILFLIMGILVSFYSINSIQFQKKTSGYLSLERQYFSRHQPDSLTNSFTRKLYFNKNYSLLSIADSSATADDHLYLRDYTTNTIYLKKTFKGIHYYAAFPIKKNHQVTYFDTFKEIHGYKCRKGIHIGEMKDTTTFWATGEIELNRTIWSLMDVDGFVLETEHQNGIKKLVKNIHWKKIDDSFFLAKIDKIRTYKKQSYYGLKIIEAEWELEYYKNSLKKYHKMKETGEITIEQYQDVEQQFQPWFQDIENRIKALEEKDKKNQ